MEDLRCVVTGGAGFIDLILLKHYLKIMFQK